MAVIKCNGCGKMFEARSNRQIYCSRTCRNRVSNYGGYVLRVGTEEKCKMCGGKFIRKHPSQIYCSPNCRENSCNRSKKAKLVFNKNGRSGEKPTERKFNIARCKKCKYVLTECGMYICNYAGVTGKICMNRVNDSKIYDIRGEDYNNCLKFVK